MIDLGIADGNILVVNRALSPKHGDIVVAETDGGVTVKQFWRGSGIVVLTSMVKIVRPTPTSIQWWLKNRRPADWKDKSEVSVVHAVPNEEECRARFTDRITAAAVRQALVRESRRKNGMSGD